MYTHTTHTHTQTSLQWRLLFLFVWLCTHEGVCLVFCCVSCVHMLVIHVVFTHSCKQTNRQTNNKQQRTHRHTPPLANRNVYLYMLSVTGLLLMSTLGWVQNGVAPCWCVFVSCFFVLLVLLVFGVIVCFVVCCVLVLFNKQTNKTGCI